MEGELDEYGLYYTDTWIGKIAETRAGSGKGTRHQHVALNLGISMTLSLVEEFPPQTVWRVLIAHGTCWLGAIPTSGKV